MNGKQQAIGVAGAALLAVNFWTDGSKTVVSTGLFKSSATDAQRTAAHETLIRFGATLLLVAVGVLIAGFSSQAGSAVLAIIAALFILWAMLHYAGGSTGATTTPKGK